MFKIRFTLKLTFKFSICSEFITVFNFRVPFIPKLLLKAALK